MKAHKDHIPHTPCTHGVPGVENIVVAEGDIDALCGQLLHPCDAPALGVGVHPALKVGIHQRVGDKVDPAHLEQPHQPHHIGVVVGVHGGGVAGSDLVKKPQFQRSGGHGLQPAGGLVVNFITVDVHQLALLGGQLQSKVQGLYAVLPGKLKVGDGSHRIGPQLHRVKHQLFAVGVAQDALLREGHDLNVHQVPQGVIGKD